MTFELKPLPDLKVSQKDIPAVQAELEAIEKRYHRLTAKLVVAHGRRHPKSILCKYIDFDNVEESAMQWWLQQAREVIRSIYVYLPEQPTLPAIRGWVNVVEPREDQRKLEFSYVPAQRALSNNRLTEQLLKKAVAEIEQWQQKYRTLVAYSKIFARIHGDVTHSLKKHRKKK
jgi:hypothetical protein